MSHNPLQAISEAIAQWQPPQDIPQDIPQGDMPGDKVWIGPMSIEKANVTFRAVLPLLKEALENNPAHKAVITVTGGSGVMKTCVSALLTYYLTQLGVGAFTMSGDNYPKRYPELNDMERMRIFRLAGVRGMLSEGVYNSENAAILKDLQQKDLDSDPAQCQQYPWLAAYLKAGREELSQYLGTEQEQEYDQIEEVLRQFKEGKEKIWLKRMGRDDTALWYEEKDFSDIDVVVLEWTHGNSGKFQGVDVPVLLASTPAETREYRLSRGRDANADTAFITMVIELEQQKLEARAKYAKVIVSKSCKLLNYDEYEQLMAAGR
ncbi:MAG: adenylylsulfate kinase [Acutalibacter sp.]|jgi:hypothetical protein